MNISEKMMDTLSHLKYEPYNGLYICSQCMDEIPIPNGDAMLLLKELLRHKHRA